MQLIRGIIFDFDNTLVNSEQAYGLGLNAVGLAPNDASYVEARKRVKARLGVASPQSHHRLLYFKELWPRASPKHLLEIQSVYEEAMTTDISRQWHDLARMSLLTAWHRRYRMVILTNETTRTQLTKWRACDPEGELFDGLICSEEVGVEKPHPEMFAAACEHLGLAPNACAMVGDSWEHDILPARALGMTTWHTTEFSQQHSVDHEAGETRTLRTLAELDKYLL